MSWLLVRGVMVLLGVAASSSSSAAQPAPVKQNPLPQSARIVPAWAYQQWLEGSAVLVDVREESEIGDGMAAPALWIATSSIDADPEAFAKLLSAFTHSRLIIFYYHSGRRAALAAALARELGYQSANMGGYADWVDAGLPTRQP